MCIYSSVAVCQVILTISLEDRKCRINSKAKDFYQRVSKSLVILILNIPALEQTPTKCFNTQRDVGKMSQFDFHQNIC